MLGELSHEPGSMLVCSSSAVAGEPVSIPDKFKLGSYSPTHPHPSIPVAIVNPPELQHIQELPGHISNGVVINGFQPHLVQPTCMSYLSETSPKVSFSTDYSFPLPPHNSGTCKSNSLGLLYRSVTSKRMYLLCE